MPVDQVTLWLVAGGVILLAFVVVGLVAVRRNSALGRREKLEIPNRPVGEGRQAPAQDTGDSPNTFDDAATATAYSLGQQLAITAWNIAFAVVLVVWAFGWSGGRILVEQSYADAKVKVTEQKAQRTATREQRKGRRVPG